MFVTVELLYGTQDRGEKKREDRVSNIESNASVQVRNNNMY
jgi:hypothetical protein